jgi:hypothetical protein
MNKPELYEVEIKYTVMVAASSETKAEQYVYDSLQDIVRDEPVDLVYCTGKVFSVGMPWKGTVAWGDNPTEEICEFFVK